MSEEQARQGESETIVRWRNVKSEMLRAAMDAGRKPDAFNLVCVSKTQDANAILPLILAGETVFGENRVQEAKQKWPLLREGRPDIRLHLIGPLQTNKVHEAVALFDAIETIDRPRLAEALAKELATNAKPGFKVFVQVNTGGEAQKSGVAPRDADELIDLCRKDFELPVAGLMCIPPASEQAAPHFALLAQIAARNGLTELSMGMSADYKIAIQLGATHVRVGTAIFGKRAI